VQVGKVQRGECPDQRLVQLGDVGLDDVVEAVEVLNVQRGQHIDARVEQFLDVLPALGVARSRDIGVRDFVDQDE